MELKKMSDHYFATGQITEEDLTEIKTSGIKTIFCFRPIDEDGTNQPSQNLLKEVAKKLDINFISIPVIPGNITKENIDQFNKEFNNCNLPALGFCRGGGRAQSIYDAYQAANHE
jgi:uncharacterized protein (TIGR01244 family)